MKRLVITGSTRGLGLGLAQEFLRRGGSVAISGRTQAAVDAALKQLEPFASASRLVGQACDVGDEAQVQALWDHAQAAFGRVDIWLNNAALSTERLPIWEQEAATVQAVIGATLLGTLNGCRVAIRGMIAQGGGHLYNFRGLGSGGEVMKGTLPYGVSKAAVSYLTKALLRETKGTPVHISTISPGILVTELLTKSFDPANAARERQFMNLMADRVETVAPWLAERVLANERGGVNIEWLTFRKLIGRFLMAPFHKRDVLGDGAVSHPHRAPEPV
jgi:NAD(P)-dependent dehydrogenase (short-subunit alcohol dehydrogenase family)